MFLFLSSELAFYFLPEHHEIPSCRPLPYFRTLITALSDFCSWNKKICPFASNVVSIRIVQHKNQCYNIVFYLVVCQLIIFNSLDSLEFYPYLCHNCCLINIENNDNRVGETGLIPVSSSPTTVRTVLVYGGSLIFNSYRFVIIR